MKISMYEFKACINEWKKSVKSDSCLVTGLKTVKSVSCCFNTFCTEVNWSNIILLALAFRWGYKCKTKLVSKYILPEHFSKDYEGTHTLEKRKNESNNWNCVS